MGHRISFHGASGQRYVFNQVEVASPWARNAGVAVFATPDTFGWRIIGISQLTGRTHDVRPLWALREAERYGASAVFYLAEGDMDTRCDIIADLQSGFSPVLGQAADVALPVAA
ncbi:MAG: hypothetical protein AAF950_02315 [Pseudomonadota bacterium]